MQDAKSLLDSLMGNDRNRKVGRLVNDRPWEDRSICRGYLVGFCPYDLFKNTKRDAGNTWYASGKEYY